MVGRASLVVVAATCGMLLAGYADGFEFMVFGGMWIWIFAVMLVFNRRDSSTSEA
jgi:hypothetical protein